MRENIAEIYEANYKTREYIASACCDIIEDILKTTYDEENPITLSLRKCSRSTQTEEGLYYRLRVQEKIFETNNSLFSEDLYKKWLKFDKLNLA
ncbi:hypothetical protein JTB14_026941 [Gonioctena quinquepunctata]|nr:hypothetical protein JTB14_026941 [Gonioctena quinquepunctata]